MSGPTPRNGAPRPRPRMIAALAVALAAAPGLGCVPLAAGGRTGRALGEGSVRGIVPGRTTKAQLFARLGAPMAIVGRGEYQDVPAATVARASGTSGRVLLQRGGSFPIQGDAALEPFADRHALGGDHRVYYWCSTEDSGLGYLVLFVAVEGYRTRTDELWVLVDESTETVVDVVHRPGG